MARERELDELLGWALSERCTDLRLLVGSAGCGKSWLARRLGERAGRLRILLIDLSVDPPCGWWRDLGWPVPPMGVAPSAETDWLPAREPVAARDQAAAELARLTAAGVATEDLVAALLSGDAVAELGRLDPQIAAWPRLVAEAALLAVAGRLPDDEPHVARAVLHRLPNQTGSALALVDALDARHARGVLSADIQRARWAALTADCRDGEALTAIEAALIGYRAGGGTMDLADALTARAVTLMTLGRVTDGLATAREAVACLEPLAADGDHGAMLNQAVALGVLRTALGHRLEEDAARAAAEQAVALARRAQVPWLMSAERVLAGAEWRWAHNSNAPNDPQPATAALRRAEAALRRLPPRRVSGIVALTQVLRSLSGQLALTGQADEALAAAEEAVELARADEQRAGRRFRHVLAGALLQRGQCLADRGQHNDALRDAIEAAALCRPLAFARPLADGLAALSALRSQALWHAATGHLAEALAAAEEAVALARMPGLAEVPALAGALSTRVALLSGSCRRRDMGRAAAEAVALARAAEPRPLAAYGHMAALLRLANALLWRFRRGEARAVLDELSALYRAQPAGPAAVDRLQAQAATHAGVLLRQVRARQQATELLLVVVERLRRTPDSNAARFGALGELSRCLTAQGRRAEAAAARRERAEVMGWEPRDESLRAQDRRLRAQRAGPARP